MERGVESEEESVDTVFIFSIRDHNRNEAVNKERMR